MTCPHYTKRPSFDDRYEVCVSCGTELRRPGVVAPPPPTGYKQTSREAYHHAGGKREVEVRIERLFATHGPMTDERLFELYSEQHGGYRNTVLPTRNALYKDGTVINTGRRDTVRSGRTAIVWALAQQRRVAV